MTDQHSHNHDHEHIHADAQIPADAPIGPNTELEMILSWEKVKPKFESTTETLSKQVKLDGFRAGKVPAKIAKAYINPERLVEYTTQKVLETEYPIFIEKSGKQPIGRPEINIMEADEGKDWKVKVIIAERPAIDLKNIDKQLKQVKKDRLEDAKKRAEENKKVVKDEKLDETLQKQQAEREVAQEKDRLLGFTYANLIMAVKPQVPELLVKQEAEEQLHNLSHQLSHFKLTFADYLSQRGVEEKAFMQEVTANALSRLQLAFLADALMHHFKTAPTPAEVTTELQKETKEAQDYYNKNGDSQAAYAQQLAQRRLEELLLAD